MKQSRILFLLGLALLPLTAAGTDQFYTNNSALTFPPQVDAVNFINNGSFNLITSAPYKTSNTRNFTNNGTMLGSLGYQFDNWVSSSGLHKLSDNFVNRIAASVEVSDSIGSIIVGGPGGPVLGSLVGGSLTISATNIVSEGLLSIGAGGKMLLTGTNINLKRSGVEVTPIQGNGSINIPFYQPDIAIYDNYWGQANLTFDSSQLINFFIASPVYPIQFPGRTGNDVIVLSDIIYGDFNVTDLGRVTLSVTNIDGTTQDVILVTNTVREAIFVGVSDTNVQVRVGFSGSSIPRNPYNTASVLLSFGSTNNVTGLGETADLFLADTIAAETPRGLLANNTASGTFRPANLLLSRRNQGLGGPGNASFDPEFFYNSTFTNADVNSEYSGYSAYVDNVVSRPPVIAAGTITNVPGRITIRSDGLDLTKTRLRGEGLLDIQAKHLVGSSNATVDSESLTFSLGSTNGNLVFQDLAKTNVTRLKGDIRSWSGVWTNFSQVITTNYSIGTNGVATRADYTNIVQVRFHELMVDGGALATTLPVSVYDFVMHSTNLTVNDSMTIVQSMKIDSQSLTVNGGISLTGVLTGWTAANTPNLKYFTNNGSITTPFESHFGDDTASPYSAFVNRGNITTLSGGQTINSDYLEIPGTNSSGAGLTINTRSGKIENGNLASAGDMRFFGDVIKFHRSLVQTSNHLEFNVTTALFDNGGTSSNLFTCRVGFSQTVKPASGDLLGTTIRTYAPIFAEVDHVWAGVDRGASKSGFLNNTALGDLALIPEGVDPLFFFSGAGVNNGLYVDLLDLSQLTDYQNQLQIDPNLVIYFAAAKLGFTPPQTNGAPQEPEEYLDGQFSGHLRWVRDFAGPNSSIDVVINGQTAKVNRALRNSMIIDSNGNGIVNGLDFFPFDGIILTSLRTPNPNTDTFSWNAISGKIYQVECATNLVPPVLWKPLFSYTNTAATGGRITIQIPASPTDPKRFYRVGYNPN